MSPQEHIEHLISDHRLKVIWHNSAPTVGCYLVEVDDIDPLNIITTVWTVKRRLNVEISPGDVGSGKLLLPRVEGQLSYWCCLHEIGHRMMGHDYTKLKNNLLDAEFEAWVWALRTAVIHPDPAKQWIKKCLWGYAMMVDDVPREQTLKEFCNRMKIKPQEVGL